MMRPLALILLLAIALAIALRTPELDRRPMHNDEAVNGIKCMLVWTNGAYKYDPNEHHGPTLFFTTFAIGRLTGASDFAKVTDTKLRLATVFFGVLLIALLPLISDGLGRTATGWAALLIAVSPALVFYSRYYIHEMLLVCFTFVVIGAGWRYWLTRQIHWALIAGAGVGLMSATKETFIFTLIVLALAHVVNRVWECRIQATAGAASPPRRFKRRHFIWAFVVAVGVGILLFSSFLTNPQGPQDFFRAYLPWFHRAEGASPHINPWYFYLHRLFWFHIGKGPVWTELFIFALASLATYAAFARRGLGDASAGFVRFLALYSFGLMAAYALIPYKTPWCLLSFWHGMVLLAGAGAAIALRAARRKAAKLAVGCIMLAGTAHLAWQAWELSMPYSADPRNPYVYAHTSANFLQLVDRVKSVAVAGPQANQTLIKVIAPDGDYWPLPWYLRNFNHVGWWETLPSDPYAPIMIVSDKLGAELDQKKTHLMAGLFELRPGVRLELYVELGLWRDWLAKNPPKPDPE